jgi:adenylate cyclase
MYEIERKFLVNQEKWTPPKRYTEIKQGYLSDDPERTIRVRIAGNKAFFTAKGKSEGIKRKEIEFEISLKDARDLMEMALYEPVEKRRYKEKTGNFTWEVDVFEGGNSGLILAEIELEHESQEFPLPEWIGKEVSDDKRYYNLSLSKNPYNSRKG